VTRWLLLGAAIGAVVGWIAGDVVLGIGLGIPFGAGLSFSRRLFPRARRR